MREKDTVRLTRFVTVPAAPLKPAGFQFSQQLQLTGFSINQRAHYLTVALRWQAGKAIEAPYKLFVHILDANGDLLAQNDQYPVGDFAPPSSWQPQTTVDDRHGLILPTAETTDYTIRIGWYLPDTGERLPVTFPTRLNGQKFVELRP